MLWAALTPDGPSTDASRRTDALQDAVQGLTTWCLQFTPRVAVIVECSKDVPKA